MSELKKMIVMRNDLNMRKGKMVAQGAHASVGAVLGYRSDPRVQQWLDGNHAKICVQVGSEDELIAVWDAAVKASLPTYIVTDAGKTEFHGVPTTTCCAIGPAAADELSTITGELRLL